MQHKSLDSDDISSESEPEVRALGSAKTLRSQVRLCHHLEIVLSSTDVAAMKNAMSLLEQISVRAPTRNSDQEIMTEFLKFCHNQIPPASVDGPATADVALVAVGNHLYASGPHKSVLFEKAVASFLCHLPEFGKAGSYGPPRGFRALKGFRLKFPGRSRKPHLLSFGQALDVDLAERDHPLMAIWVLLAVHGYLRP